jgi:hypothetical protein
MRGKILFVAGVAAGYVWGSRSGAKVYRGLRDEAARIWRRPAVQESVHQAARVLADGAPDPLADFSATAHRFLDRVESMVAGFGEPRPSNGTRVPLRPDIVADPALTDAEGQDWSNEGGATPEGPATDTKTPRGT